MYATIYLAFLVTLGCRCCWMQWQKWKPAAWTSDCQIMLSMNPLCHVADGVGEHCSWCHLCVLVLYQLCICLKALLADHFAQARSQGGSERSDDPPTLKGHLSTDCLSANILNIVHLWNGINEIECNYHVDLSFDYKVTSSIIITSDKGGGKYICPRLLVCLSVC